jgi:hypothetical protein
VSNPKAVRYRRLALVETDPDKARLLQKLADEADQGILITADWRTRSSEFKPPPVPVISNQT